MRKNKIIKFIVISILLLIILMQNINSFAAPVPVTKENLEEAFEELEKLSENEGEKIEITVEDNIINFKIEGVNYKTKYDLLEKPVFITELEINKGISYDEYEVLNGGFLLPLFYSYAAVSKIQGIEFEDSMTYSMMTFLSEGLSDVDFNDTFTIICDLEENGDNSATLVDYDKTTSILESDFPNRVIEYVDRAYSKELSINDSKTNNTFKINIKKENITDNSRKLITNLEINLDGNFEDINNASEELENDLNDMFNSNLISNSVSNSISNPIIDSESDPISDPISDTTSNSNNNQKEKYDTIAMANKLLRENEGKTYSGATKYPNAGLETNIFVPVIKVLIGMLAISLMFVIIKARKNKKD